MKEHAMDTELSREIDAITASIYQLQENHRLELDAARKIAQRALTEMNFLRDEIKELKVCINEAIATHLEEGCDPSDGWLQWAKSLVSK